MKANDFVTEIKKSIIDENLSIYKDLFKNTLKSETTDSYWIEALNFFEKLDSNERSVLFKIIKQTQIDTLSNLFAILDGVTWLDNQKADFKLKVENSNNIISGSLQDIFLELTEK